MADQAAANPIQVTIPARLKAKLFEYGINNSIWYYLILSNCD
jgi:hypothetical protein